MAFECFFCSFSQVCVSLLWPFSDTFCDTLYHLFGIFSSCIRRRLWHCPSLHDPFCWEVRKRRFGCLQSGAGECWVGGWLTVGFHGECPDPAKRSHFRGLIIRTPICEVVEHRYMIAALLHVCGETLGFRGHFWATEAKTGSFWDQKWVIWGSFWTVFWDHFWVTLW